MPEAPDVPEAPEPQAPELEAPEPEAPEPAAAVPPPPIAPPRPAVPPVPQVDVHAGDRLQTVEAMLRDRQRAFLELVSTTETLRRAVSKLQDELAEKDAEIARLRLQATA